jgi:excisionase family DNA binding protein
MLLTVDAAAALLQCNPETLRRHIRSGEVKAHKVAGSFKVESDDLALPPRVLKSLISEWRASLDRVAARELAK